MTYKKLMKNQNSTNNQTLLDVLTSKFSSGKKYTGLNLNKLVEEINSISAGNLENQRRHNVKMWGSSQTSYESKVLNKYFNHTGAGDYRILTNNGQFRGIASHVKKGKKNMNYNSLLNYDHM